MKKLVNKISFHIPGFKYVDGKMLNVYIGEFKEALSKEVSIKIPIHIDGEKKDIEKDFH